MKTGEEAIEAEQLSLYPTPEQLHIWNNAAASLEEPVRNPDDYNKTSRFYLAYFHTV